jgi:hypothetical protein
MSVDEISEVRNVADVFPEYNNVATPVGRQEKQAAASCLRLSLEFYLDMLHPMPMETKISKRTNVFLFLVVFLVSLLTTTSFVMLRIARKSRPSNVKTLLNVSSSRFCTHDECMDSQCNAHIAPFLCLVTEGSSIGGW